MITISVEPRRYLAFGLGAAVVLVLVGIGANQLLTTAPGNWYLISAERFLSTSGEGTVPTWYSSVQLAVAAALFIVFGLELSRRTRTSNMWLIAGLLFLFLSVDEVVAIHERLDKQARNALDIGFVEIPQWIAFTSVAAAFGLLIMYRWWVGLPGVLRTPLAIGIAVFLAGAIGVDELRGSPPAVDDGALPFSYILSSGLEEFLEMSGITVAVYGLLRYAWSPERQELLEAKSGVAATSPPSQAPFGGAED